MTDKPRSPFMDASPREIAIIGLCVLPVAIAIGEYAGYGRGTIALVAATCIGGSIRLAWPLHRQYWFWGLIGIVTLLHVLAIALFDWSFAADWSKRQEAAAVYADFGSILGMIYLLYRIIYGVPAQTVEANPNDLPRYNANDIDL